MKPIFIEEYNYQLPEERIAKFPLARRDASKLLVWRAGEITQAHFFNLAEYLSSKTLLVYNNTRVLQARLHFTKSTGAQIEIFCLEPLMPPQYERSLAAQRQCTWKCMLGNAKKWKDGILTQKLANNATLTAEKLQTLGNAYEVLFRWDDDSLSFAEILEQVGEIPLPPYLHRATIESDKTTYQTVYSRIKGSVAAPTAGLHFTDNLLREIRQKHISTEEITLHVGAGTFQPIKTDDANEHIMHTELFEVKSATIESILQHLGNIVAVGTTTTRTLESLYYLGEMLAEKKATKELIVPQFIAYEKEHCLTTEQALENILIFLKDNHLDSIFARTQIMIEPSFPFRIVDGLITNFHQPKSTLLLLVDAFVHGAWRQIYDYALAHDFRFLSYGDSNLYFREK